MIIERFKNGDATAVGERFKAHGRMLPDSVSYLSSWMDLTGARCFQLMEAGNRSSLDAWTSRWSDLVDFEIIPVETSAEFWARIETQA